MANGPTDILSAIQNGVVALNSLFQALNAVTSTSSGQVTIRLTTSST